MENTEKIAIARAPFDDHTNCDIIFRSADDVDFHVFKLILSLMSPVFKDMITLPQNESQPGVSSVPIITVTESSTILESLLLLCYPATTPTFGSLDDANMVMKAARKYDMQAALTRVADLAMAQFLPNHFLELYALSCRFGWPHHAQTAATRALEIRDLGRPSNIFNGMRDLTALDYHRLLDYHYRCSIAAQAVGGSLSWLDISYKYMQMWKECHCKNSRSVTLQAQFGNVKVAMWFHEYLVSSGKELLARPCGATLTESSVYNLAIAKATGCDYCRACIVQHMDAFRTLYIAQVEKVVATVKLETYD
ncbi:hypothetical protein BDR04DRAFT_1133244 [Suillus decipiens]|nr:hypothetical protein BDR04DRAFT_1133244 [Suillus decipiens]